MNNEEMTKQQYYMNIAKLVSIRSSCLTRQVGAILVKDDHIISTGYNGTPRGMLNCNKGGCLRCKDALKGVHKSNEKLDDCLCLHAEENAILQSARLGISTNGAELYTELFPCLNCAKLLVNAGIKKIYWSNPYGDVVKTSSFLADAKITMKRILDKFDCVVGK